MLSLPLFWMHDADSLANLKQKMLVTQPDCLESLFLLFGVLVSTSSAGALAECSLLQACPENWTWAMPRVEMPSSEIRNPGEGYKSLAPLSQGKTTLQYKLFSRAWEGLGEAISFPYVILWPSLPYKCLLKELSQYITGTWSSDIGSVSRELNLKHGLRPQDT